MEIWHIWVIIALIFVIIEIFTSGFAVMCISIGALFGAIASALDWEFKWQILVFAIGTIIALLTIRPLVYKIFYNKTKEIKKNAGLDEEKSLCPF